LQDFVAWISDNKQWLFSGLGLAIVAWVWRLIIKKRASSSTQTIRSGNNSTNVQVGGNANIRTK